MAMLPTPPFTQTTHLYLITTLNKLAFAKFIVVLFIGLIGVIAITKFFGWW